MKTQVNTEHYKADYDSLERFISYYYQISQCLNLNPCKILEIGIGNRTVSNYLKQSGLNVTTCDFDANLKPDIVADIRDLSDIADSFDLVLACEILEHIPFEEVSVALLQLHKVSKKHVIISIPYSSGSLELILKTQIFEKLFNKPFFDFFIRVPMLFCPFKFDGEHYWKMGRRKYSIRKIRKLFCENFNIIKEVRPIFNSYHYFFILEKK